MDCPKANQNGSLSWRWWGTSHQTLKGKPNGDGMSCTMGIEPIEPIIRNAAIDKTQ